MLTPEKIARIHALYLRGEKAESEAAEKILRAAGIDPETYADPCADPCVVAEIPFKNKIEQDIVFNVIAKIIDSHSIAYLRNPKKVSVKVPKSKLKKAVEDSKTILNLWRKELERFKHAFIIRNRLFPETDKGGQETKLSQEEIFDILEMAKNIKQVHLGNLFEKW